MKINEETRKMLDKKKRDVEKAIVPVLNAFGIKEWRYEYTEEEPYEEWLTVNGQKICCTWNSEEAILMEIVGYLFLTRHPAAREDTAEEIKSRIYQYWIKEYPWQYGKERKKKI